MSAVFVKPLPFTVSGSSPTPFAGTATLNLNNDVPGMVWRGSVVSYFVLDLGAGPLAYDYVALVGTNLRASDTVRVRTGNTDNGIGGYAGGALPAWSGIKPDLSSAITIIALGELRGERFIRIDLSAPSHPANFVEAQRCVVGRAATVVGIQYGAEVTYNDRSETASGLGYESVDEGDFVPSMKISTAFISDVEWRTNWTNLMTWAALKRAVLFIPDTDTPSNWITDAIFGRLSKGGGKIPIIGAWVFEGTITALSQ
jgi:hypothetical protein